MSSNARRVVRGPNRASPKTITAIAETRPRSRAALVAVPGIGATKLDRYGAAVPAIVAGGEPPAADAP